MTNFELVTQSPNTLEAFLEMVVNDALEAKGCSWNLTMPDEERVCGLWSEWLAQEADGGSVCTTSRGDLWAKGRGV